MEKIGQDTNAKSKEGMGQSMNDDRTRLWITRGIGAFRVEIPANKDNEWLTWVKRHRDHDDEEGLTWYVDASQIDSESELTRRFGFGVVAVDQLGRLKAAAFGAPPEYVQTIAQAEAHAVAIVLQNTICRAEIVTDCLSNVTLLNNGLKAATNGKKRAARTWTMIANAVDWDQSGISLRWIPAHTAWANSGKDTNARGDRISRLDWQCNRAVDTLAKLAAERHRTDWRTRSRLQKTRNYTRTVRSRLGAVTWASQNISKEVPTDDGTKKVCMTRDSVGKLAGNAPRRLAKKRVATGKAAPLVAHPSARQCADDDSLRKMDPNALTSPLLQWDNVAAASDKLLQACKSRDAACSNLAACATHRGSRTGSARLQTASLCTSAPGARRCAPTLSMGTRTAARRFRFSKFRSAGSKRRFSEVAQVTPSAEDPKLPRIDNEARNAVATQLAATAASAQTAGSLNLSNRHEKDTATEEQALECVLNVLNGIQNGYSTDPSADMNLCGSVMTTYQQHQLSVAPTTGQDTVLTDAALHCTML